MSTEQNLTQMSLTMPETAATEPEVTAAVRRAADVLFAAEVAGLILDDVRAGLAAAFDVEAMARFIADDLYVQNVATLMMRRPGESHRDQAERIGQWAAEIIGAAIVGENARG